MHVSAKDWETRQRDLDKESDRLMLEWKLDLLPEYRFDIHTKFHHDPQRCRCFALEGLE